MESVHFWKRKTLILIPRAKYYLAILLSSLETKIAASKRKTLRQGCWVHPLAFIDPSINWKGLTTFSKTWKKWVNFMQIVPMNAWISAIKTRKTKLIKKLKEVDRNRSRNWKLWRNQLVKNLLTTVQVILLQTEINIFEIVFEFVNKKTIWQTTTKTTNNSFRHSRLIGWVNWRAQLRQKSSTLKEAMLNRNHFLNKTKCLCQRGEKV